MRLIINQLGAYFRLKHRNYPCSVLRKSVCSVLIKSLDWSAKDSWVQWRISATSKCSTSRSGRQAIKAEYFHGRSQMLYHVSIPR